MFESDLAILARHGDTWTGRFASGPMTQGRTLDEVVERLGDLACLDLWAAAEVPSQVLAVPLCRARVAARPWSTLVVSGQELVNGLQRLRFALRRRSRDHAVLARPLDGRAVVVPLDNRVARATLDDILLAAAVTSAELRAVL
jgi:hypothetical protein